MRSSGHRPTPGTISQLVVPHIAQPHVSVVIDLILGLAPGTTREQRDDDSITNLRR